MVKPQSHSKKSVNKGAWTAEEDRRLSEYIRIHGDKKWRTLPARAGLNRCGKSCRLRWLNYLRPDIKRGNISEEEEDLIIRLHNLLGNRWSLIAGRLPGRTDNEIKNYWNIHLGKKSLSMNELNHKINSKVKISGKPFSPTITCPASSNPQATNENVGVDSQKPWSDLLDNDLEADLDVDIDRFFDFVGSNSAGTDQGLSNSILDDKQVFEANAGMFSELLDYGLQSPAMELSYEESKFDLIDLDTLSRFLDSDLSHPSGDLSLVL